MLKRRLLILAVLAAALFAVSSPSPAAAQTTAQSTATYLRVVSPAYLRAHPSWDGTLIRVLAAGERLTLLSRYNSSFYRVRTARGEVGYVTRSTRYIEPVSGSVPGSGSKPLWEQRADRVISTGLKYRGVPYVWGGTWARNRAFDCSTFVAHVFREALGMRLPLGSRDQARLGYRISARNLRKGDLVFFWRPSRGRNQVGHVAIYMGNDRLLHTYKVGVGVTVTPFRRSSWWSSHYLFSRRIL